MKRLLLLLMLPLMAPAQDDEKIRRLIDDLQGDDPRGRDEAAKKLVALGDAVKPSMERLRKGSDPELRARAETIVKEIERLRRVRDFWQAPHRLTLNVANRPAGEVAAEIEKQCGYKIDASPLGKIALSADIRNLPFLQALCELCRKNPGVACIPPPTRDSPALLQPTPYPAAPRHFFNQYAACIESVRLNYVRDLMAQTQETTLNFTVRVDWEPANRPVSAQVELTNLVDQNGKSLKDLLPKEPALAPNLPRDATSTQFEIALAGPLQNIESFSTVKGNVSIFFPANLEVLRVPLAASGPSKGSSDSFDIEVARAEATKDECSFQIKFVDRAAIDEDSLPELHLTDRQGKEISGACIESSGVRHEVKDGHAVRIRSWKFKFGVKPADAVALVFTHIKELWSESFDFDFKDVSLD